MDQRTDTVVAFCGLQDGFELGAVGEAEGGAGGVGEELFGEVAGDSFVLGEEEVFKVADVVKRLAVGELAGGIDGEAVVEGEGVAVFAAAGFGVFFFVGAAVAVAPGTQNIEAFEGEAGWVDDVVADGAGLVGAVFFELLADGDGTADVGFDGGDGGRRGDLEAEDALHDPFAAENG